MTIRVKSVLSLGTSIAAIAIACAGATAARAQDAPPVTASEGEEEIVVTAQRRAQSLLKVPASIAALGEKRLEELGIDDVQDYADFIPSLDVTATAPGITKTTIRGLSSESVTSSVGVYINETPVTQNELDPDLKLFDVNRVEVLRGPQGTLYGEGSLGGTIRIITNAPDPSGFSSDVQVGISSFKNSDSLNYSVNGMVNVPLVDDKAALRIVAGYRDNAGWITNAGPGNADNDERSWFVRGAVAFQLTEDLDATFTVIHQDIAYGSPRNIIDPTLGDLTRFTRVDESIDDEMTIASLTFNWDLGFATLTSDTSYYERTQNTIGNNNQTSGVDFFYTEMNAAASGRAPFSQFTCRANPAAPGCANFPFSRTLESVVDFTGSATQWSQELRLVSNTDEDDLIQWIAGVFYKNRDDTKDTYFYGLNPSPFLLNVDTTRDWAGRTKTAFGFEQFAIYGEVTWNITDKAHLTGGLRYATETVDNQENLSGLFQYTFGSFPPRMTPVQFGPVQADFETWNPRVVFSYDLSEDWLFYASIAKGFRSGGFVGVTPFSPDTVWNYELGTKGRFWGGKATLAAAAYFTRWNDVQAFDDIPNPPFFAVLNLGEAEVKGLELELTLQPTEGLQILLGGNLTETEITKLSPKASATPDLVVGNHLQKVPPYTFNMQVNYEWPAFGDMQGLISANLVHQASSYSDFRNLEAEKLKAYTTVGLRLGVENETWGVYLYGKNLTDVRIPLDIATGTSAAILGTTVARPRVIGIEFKASFN